MSGEDLRLFSHKKAIGVLRAALLLAALSAPASLHASVPTAVQFTGASTGSASLSWSLDTPGTEQPLMAISTAPDFSVAFSSATGALGAQTTAYYGLAPNTTYYFKVKVSTEPDAAYSVSATTITNPNPPAAPLVTGVFFSSITITWADDGNSAGTVYFARAALDEAFTAGLKSTLTVAGSYSFEGLTLNGTYYIKARTIGFSEFETDDVSFGSTITLAAQPLSPVYTAVQSTAVFLSWNENGNLSGTSYSVLVSSDDFQTLYYSSSVVGPALEAAALAPNTTFYFQVASLNAAGMKSGYTLFPSTLTRANVPQAHATTFPSVTADTVDVQWLKNSNPAITEYFLNVATSSNFSGQDFGPLSWFTWASVVPVTPLDAGVTFYFQVKARDALQRETAWLYLSSVTTISGPDTVPPSVTYVSGGNTEWRGAASGLYNVEFVDLGSGLSKFQVKLATSTGLAGTPLIGWTDVVTNINAPSYTTGWQLPAAAFQTITEGVTAYVSVRVEDLATPANVTVSTDVFYVRRDTTPPVIVNNAVSPVGWRLTDPGVFNVDFSDARSGLAYIRYSASGLAGSADAAVLGWTDIDTLVSSGSYAVDWGVAFASLAGGATNYISVRAIDMAGNTSTVPDAFKILKAAGSPGVSLLSPSAAFISTASSVSGSASGGNDGVSVNFVEVWLKNLTNGNYYDGSAGTFTSGVPLWLRAAGAEAWTLNIATYGLVNLSSYTAVARAYDSLARYSLTYATATFTVDQDPPSVFLSSPAALSTVYTLDLASGTASDTGSGPALAGISVKRLADGKWWNFPSRTWGAAQVSSMTPVSGGNWLFFPDEYLRGDIFSGSDYFLTASASDAAAPANSSAFGAVGSTFTFIDTTPPGQITAVAASSGALPGRLNVAWTAAGDDGAAVVLGNGEFAIKYSTYTGFAYSTASAQVLVATAAIAPGSAQAYLVSGLTPAATYYLRLWVKDDAGLWSAASPEFSALSGDSLPDEIDGHVRTSLGTGITGVLVEAFSAFGGVWSGYTVDDGSGTFRLTALDPSIYRIQVTWTLDGITSAVSKDGIPVGYADTDFTLSVSYSLASVSGVLPSSVPGRRASFAASGISVVELYQNGRRIASVRVEADGSFHIGNILPGEYELRAPGMKTIPITLRSGENLVVRPGGELILGESLYAYPNPARTRVTFRLQTEEPSAKEEISVFDVGGRLVKKIRNEDPGWDRSNPLNIHLVTWEFSASGPASGIYLYKVNMKSATTGKTLVKTGKFAVVR